MTKTDIPRLSEACIDAGLFENWLRSQDVETIVGDNYTTVNHPLSNYLTETCGFEVIHVLGDQISNGLSDNDEWVEGLRWVEEYTDRLEALPWTNISAHVAWIVFHTLQDDFF